MRLRIHISTTTRQLPWEDLLRPGRGLAYRLLAHSAPELGTRLHHSGWGIHRMVPFGYCSPTFPWAPRRPGIYTVGGPGYLELGSPLPELVDAWINALTGQPTLTWGNLTLRIHRLQPLPPPKHPTGHAELRTRTPVILKTHTTALRDHPPQPTSTWLLPYEKGFIPALENNLRRKAETLNLDPDITIERLTWVGAKRSLAVGTGRKVGAPVGVELRGSPAILSALTCWGLGEANAAGFGWITA